MESAVLTGKVAGILPDDGELVRRILMGELELFELLMRRSNPRLFRVARAIVGDDDEAEDVLQQTYLNAFAQLRSFEGRARLSTWLTRIAANEALARVRQRRRLVATEDEEEIMWHQEPERSRPSPEADAASGELKRILEQALDELPPNHRAILVLRDVEELSTLEAATCLGITEESAKVRLHRARAQLRERLSTRIDSVTKEIFSFHLKRCDRVVAAVLMRLSQLSS
jgi:RNA polymerase sigma-70 factor, ECF subfamily